MKRNVNARVALMAFRATLIFIFSAALSAAAPALAQGDQSQPAQVSARDMQAIAAFEKRVKDYVRLREGLEDRMPKLAAQSTPEQIEAHQTAFEATVRRARAGAKRGDVFSPGIMRYIRQTISDEFRGSDRRHLREMVFEADTKGVPIRVNHPYPEDKELTEIPATLLMRLPQLPKQVKYRFVNRYLLLVDRENGLIVDYMPNALP